MTDVTTVLLVSARPGQSSPPVGLLAKTARTFVQDGASTEYATQVVGTTLDNGRLYARILSTSSRVFYDNDSGSNAGTTQPTRSNPYVVYPSRVAPQDEWKLFGGVIEDDTSADKREEAIIRKEISSSSSSSSSSQPQDRENDIFELRREFNVDNHQRFKPAKVRAAANLPTYTVKQELIGSANNYDVNDDDGHRIFRPRVPKIFKSQSSRINTKKESPRPLNTVTYHGFADFTTIVGDTVIVFSPSTSPAPIGRAATTIKGDATLRPGDGSVLSIQPTSVMQHQKTVDPLLDAINGNKRLSESVTDNLSPSVVEQLDDSLTKSTPLLVIDDSMKPTGLLKVVDSTTSLDGTTTHYKSHIYGTYIGTNYAQIIHTSSNVYFFPDEASVSYDTTTYSPEDDKTDETLTTFAIDTTTTSSSTDDIDETLSPDDNDLTTPVEETTDSIVKTFKVASTTPMEPEIPNDIVGDPQGRSVKGGSSKNNVADNNDKKLGFATRLLPSTAYKTFTYFTTFFIPDETKRHHTTTSIKSREVVSSEISYLTELILPSTTIEAGTTTLSSSVPTKPLSSSIKVEEDEQTTKREEIELIFKTLYTTYTYLTTFFQESTSSVSSREVVETNVVTQTIGPDGIFGDVAGLFSDDVVITPTKIQDNIQPTTTKIIVNDEETTTYEISTSLDDTTTETSFTTLSDNKDIKTTIEENFEGPSQLEPSPTPSLVTDTPKSEIKTYFTTYTYFTTIFVDDETEIETRTEVFSNVVTESIEPTAVVPPPPSSSVQKSSVVSTTPKSEAAVPPEILAYLEALKKQKSQEEVLKTTKKIPDSTTTQAKTTVNPEVSDETTTEELTTEKAFFDGEVLGSMRTDVSSSSSSSDGPVLEPSMDKRNVGSLPEDQELSESNHHDVEPAPTLLLRTSYTTFTYFTTMYKGDASNVVSRLDTVTNIVTETIRPTPAMEMPITETSTLPVTYFTTFTYWTTLYRAGDTITTSREETVSNIVTPAVTATSAVKLGVIMTYRPDSTTESIDEDITDMAIADNEVMMHDKSTTPIPQPKEIIFGVPQDQPKIDPTNINPEPTTYYTTFTYFTTSYIGNETVLNSRLETITSVALGDPPKPTGRAIGTSVVKIQDLETDDKTHKVTITPTKINDEPKTGLISTIKSSEIINGITTHFTTDIYGTYIDGLYAQLVQSSTSLETPTSTIVPTLASATPQLPTGVLSLNKGSIIDADKVTTVFFATSQIGTLIDGLYAKIIESTSSTKIDAERKATLKPSEERHKTGLVRLIKGQIEAAGSTVVYQSKVIGTNIDGRYAQIIESTSSYLLSSTLVLPTPTSATGATLAPDLPSPTPAVIQSSISDNSGNEEESNEDENEGEDEDDEGIDEEDENGQKSTKKSRLTFSSRKRTFTPVIRPFLSRSRPTFNPKRKGAQGATTITRTDITPTITATLAGSKSNRFASSRGRPASSATAATSINPSRRFSGRRGSSSLTTTPSLSSSVRGRASGRISVSPTFSVARRGPSSIRGSSARPAIRGSSSIYPGASSRFRGGIRPSSALPKSLQSVNPTQIKSDDQEDEANEFTATTFVTEETPYSTEFDDNEDTATTIPIKTTTESSRRSTNPLLRFRRPLNISPAARVTPSPRRTTSKTPTVARSSNARSLNTPTVPPFTPRSRNNNRLFPSRNLANQRQPEPVEDINPDDDTVHLEDERAVEEIVDNDYEGSENNKRRRVPAKNETTTTTVRSSFGSRYNGQRRRYKRQVSQLRSYQSNRYRRPGTKTTSAEDRSDIEAAGFIDDDIQKPSTRYNVRGRSLSTSRAPNKSSAEKYAGESGEVLKSRTRRPTTNGRVKPSPTMLAGRQFTLREKNPPAYKRTSTKQDNLRRPSGRVRTTTRRPSDSQFDSRRGTTSRTSSRTRTGSRRIPQRGRGGSREDLRDYGREDATISVTHYIPTEVTIPVVANGITEHRSIITASPSIEILSPDRYSTVTGGDGRPLVVIASESSAINAHGQTEVTRFLLHSTPTTRVSHTLSTIGGRRVSQSLIVPSTVYSVENVVSTIPASVTEANAPLANILLSQLLLGQLGQQNGLLGGLQPTEIIPTTRYDTRTTTYVTTITKQRSTVIPLTFRGKEIMTTLVDSSTDIVTATEFITDTVVVTPTAALPAANLNSLLLLLQQSPQASQQSQDLFAVAPIYTQSNSLPGEVERRQQPADLDYRPEDDASVSIEEYDKSVRPRVKAQKKEAAVEYSIVTIYVSGKRPGEFSTVLSTVKIGEESTASRRRRDLIEEVRPSIPASLYGNPQAISRLSPSEETVNAHTPTQSLESVVGDVGRHISTSIRA